MKAFAMSGSVRLSSAIIVVLILLSATSYARATLPPPLSDQDAARLIESWFAGSGWTESLRTGVLVVTRETPACAGNDFEHGRISETEYRSVLAWTAAGLIKLKVSDITVRQPLYMQPISTACVPLVLKRVVVTPTIEGLALDGRTPVTGVRDARFLYVKSYTAEVSKIVDNSEFVQSSDTYRIIKCIVRFQYSDVGRLLTTLRLGRVLKYQKEIVLLKYDPFDQRWNLVTSDATAFDSGFKTQKVADYLLQHGSL
jgi:hypothetical protein